MNDKDKSDVARGAGCLLLMFVVFVWVMIGPLRR